MNAQVSFLDGTLSLIHIPLDLYPNLLQPILKVLLPPSQNPNEIASGSLTVESHENGFLNISVTPIECSIVCNSAWAKSVFEPAVKRLPKDQAKAVAISKDTYAALSVYGAGVDPGSRVADLTSPLALANIPIFFITTYYSDFILVPVKDREAVVKTLLAKGFVFSEDNQSQLVSAHPSPTATSHHAHGFNFGYGAHSRAGSQGSGPLADRTSASSTPEPGPTVSSVNELQERTFDLLKRRNITPHVEPGLALVHCTGIRGAASTYHLSLSRPRGGTGGSGGGGGGSGNVSGPGARPQSGLGGVGGGGNHTIGSRRGSRTAAMPCWVDTIDAKLYASVVAALVSQPRFLSMTLAHEDPPSLLLDRELLSLFGDSLVGPTEGALVPIFLDLADLPFEATGIVSGVAGRLVREMRTRGADAAATTAVVAGGELSYLSTARAGAVILSREQAEQALEVLRPLLEKD